MTAKEASDTSVAGNEIVCHACPNARIRWKKSPGTLCIRNPKKSRICVLAIRMAMPLVKPMITGRGKYLTAVPMPVIPSSTNAIAGAKMTEYRTDTIRETTAANIEPSSSVGPQ